MDETTEQDKLLDTQPIVDKLLDEKLKYMYETVLDLIAMGKKEIANDVLTVFYETYCKNTLVDETTPKLIKKISRMYNGLVNKKTDGPKPS